MRSWLQLALPISSVPLLATALLLPSSGQARRKTTPKPDASVPAKAAPDTTAFDKSAFDKTTTAFFTQSCASCHNAKAKAGGLDLQSLSHAGSFAVSMKSSRETWESIVRKVRSGEMPPPGSPKPRAAQVKAVMQRIEAELERADRLAASNPGRVTARRLNRAEYNNTIRDLLGVNIRPADDFPQDDSGYGFDNIGDVLSLSLPRRWSGMWRPPKRSRGPRSSGRSRCSRRWRGTSVSGAGSCRPPRFRRVTTPPA